MAEIVALGGGPQKAGFAEISLPIFVSYGEPSNPALTVQDILLGTRVHSPEGGGQEGTDAVTIPLELDIMRVVWGKGQGAPGYMQLSPVDGVISTAAF